jgi:hypothetical protein
MGLLSERRPRPDRADPGHSVIAARCLDPEQFDSLLQGPRSRARARKGSGQPLSRGMVAPGLFQFRRDSK